MTQRIHIQELSNELNAAEVSAQNIKCAILNALKCHVAVRLKTIGKIYNLQVINSSGRTAHFNLPNERELIRTFVLEGPNDLAIKKFDA